jgi:hypothetical protein
VLAVGRALRTREEDVHHGAHDVDLGRAEAPRIVPEARGRELPEDREARADPERAHRGVGLRVDVKERQRRQQAIVAREAKPRRKGLGGEREGPVRLHHGLGRAGGARGGDEHRDVVDPDVRARRALSGRRERLRPDELRRAAARFEARRLREGAMLVADHQDPGTNEPEQRRQLGRLEGVVERRGDGPEPVRGEPREERLRPVAQQERDAIPLDHAALRQSGREALHLARHVGERPRVALEEEPRTGRSARRTPLQ